MANEIDQQISAILNDPAAMQKIMNMAQALSGAKQEPPKKEEKLSNDIDIAALQNISRIASQGSIDRQQQSLLAALSPYLSKEKLIKLENAMRAAKMTKVATSFLNAQKRSNGR